MNEEKQPSKKRRREQNEEDQFVQAKQQEKADAVIQENDTQMKLQDKWRDMLLCSICTDIYVSPCTLICGNIDTFWFI